MALFYIQRVPAPIVLRFRGILDIKTKVGRDVRPLPLLESETDYTIKNILILEFMPQMPLRKVQLQSST